MPDSGRTERVGRGFDVAGAVAITGAMLLLVYTLVEAPNAGWTSARTLASFVGAAALLARLRRARAAHARRRSCGSASCARRTLVRANLAAMTLFGSWVGFQFIATLYMQQLRGWSALETGLAIFPAGVLVAVISTRIAPLVMRFGVTRLIVAGLRLDRRGLRAVPADRAATRATRSAMLPTFLLAGLGFALAFGPLNIAATSGVAARGAGARRRPPQHVVPVRRRARAGRRRRPSSTPTPARAARRRRVLDGFHPALIVPLGRGRARHRRDRPGLLRRTARAVAGRPSPSSSSAEAA